MSELGRFTDTKGTVVRVVAEGGNLRIYADPQPHYPDPSPHMNAGMAAGLAMLLAGPAGASPEGVSLGATERGFTDYGEPIIDLDGHEVVVRESSICGDPCVWVFCNDPEPRRQRYEDHKAYWFGCLTEEQREARLPNWIRYDFSSGTADHDQLRDYSDCPEEKEKLITSYLHQDWPGEPDLPPSPTPRLTPSMAQEVALRLAAFVQDSGDPNNWRNSPEYRAAFREDDSEDIEA